MVSVGSDVLPFQTESEAQSFCGMAARRFKAHLRTATARVHLRDPSHITTHAADRIDVPSRPVA